MVSDSEPDLIPGETNGINTLNEKSLHAALKQWYVQPDDRLEARVDGFIIDLVRGELLIEIQTGSFSPLKRKLAVLARTHPVRLVFPIAQEKWIIRLQPDGATTRRKSPIHGHFEQLFKQLVYIPQLITQENFTLEVLLIREEEVRRFDASKAKAWRRKGWVTHERRLLEVVERRLFCSPTDLANMIPANLADPFTVRELAKATGQPEWLARKMIYCLRAIGIVAVNGKRSRSILYTRGTEKPAPPTG